MRVIQIDYSLVLLSKQKRRDSVSKYSRIRFVTKLLYEGLYQPHRIPAFIFYKLNLYDRLEPILGAEGLHKPPASASGYCNHPLTHPENIWAVRAPHLKKTHAVELREDYALVTGRASGSVVVFDISNLNELEYVETVRGEQLKQAHGLSSAGDYAFVTCDKAARVTVLDITDITCPEVIASCRDTERLNVVKRHHYEDGLLYCAVEGSHALTVVDVTEPTSPTIIGHVADEETLTLANDVYVRNGTAYVAARGGHFAAVDVTDPTAPTVLGTKVHSDLRGPKNCTVDNQDIAYVAARGADALTSVDVSNEKSMTLLDSISNNNFQGTQEVALDDQVNPNYAYVTNRRGTAFVVVDVSDPTDLREVATIDSWFDFRDPQYVVYRNGLAYIASDGSNSLTIVG